MPRQSGSVILAGARTPMGRLLGALRGFSGVDLGGIAIKGALERSGLPADRVGYVIMDRCCRPARDRSVPARPR
jgi:acetyl-CoA C-acetyltransferase